MSLCSVYRAAGPVYDGDQWACGFPTFNALYAGYLLGTDYWAGTGRTPITDCSLQDRDLVLTGEIGALALAGNANHADTPFTGADLCAETGEATIVGIVNTPPANAAYPIGNRVSGTSGVQWMTLYQLSGSIAARAAQRLNGSEQNSSETDNDTTRSGYELLAGAFRPAGAKLWRSKTGGGLREFAETASPVLASSGGPLPFRIGRSHSTPAESSATSIAAALFYSRRLTTPELAQVLAALTTFLSGHGLTVAQ